MQNNFQWGIKLNQLLLRRKLHTSLFLSKVIQSLNLSPDDSPKESKRPIKLPNLFIHFSSNYLGTSQLRDKIPYFTASFCVYSFTCSCGTSCIGRTTRRLSDRVREHHPVWLSKGQVRNTCTSAILNHLIESNHNVDIKKSFNIVYRIPYHKPKLTKFRLLAISEAISIRLCDPELCSQKQFVRSLNLPWPSVESSGLYKLNSLRHHRNSNVC